MAAKYLNKRPKHLNLFKINQPLPAIVSIMHRISGVILFFPGIPLILLGLQMLLDTPESFEALQTFFLNPLVKFGLTCFIWLCLHHLCAGIRHLALDLHCGVELAKARASSNWVLIVSVSLTLITAGVLIW